MHPAGTTPDHGECELAVTTIPTRAAAARATSRSALSRNAQTICSSAGARAIASICARTASSPGIRYAVPITVKPSVRIPDLAATSNALGSACRSLAAQTSGHLSCKGNTAITPAVSAPATSPQRHPRFARSSRHLVQPSSLVPRGRARHDDGLRSPRLGPRRLGTSAPALNTARHGRTPLPPPRRRRTPRP